MRALATLGSRRVHSTSAPSVPKCINGDRRRLTQAAFRGLQVGTPVPIIDCNKMAASVSLFTVGRAANLPGKAVGG